MLAMDDMEAWMSTPGLRSASRHASVTIIVCHVVRLTRSLRALDLKTLVRPPSRLLLFRLALLVWELAHIVQRIRYMRI